MAEKKLHMTINLDVQHPPLRGYFGRPRFHVKHIHYPGRLQLRLFSRWKYGRGWGSATSVWDSIDQYAANEWMWNTEATIKHYCQYEPKMQLGFQICSGQKVEITNKCFWCHQSRVGPIDSSWKHCVKHCTLLKHLVYCAIAIRNSPLEWISRLSDSILKVDFWKS